MILCHKGIVRRTEKCLTAARSHAPEEHEGKEASVARVQTLIDECRKDCVQVILCQEQHSDRTTQTIAKELGLPIHTINPLSYDWDKEIVRIADLIAQ